MISRILALFIFVFIFPILIVISFIIFIDDGFPLIFVQKRFGKNNSFFWIYKFRTMKKNMTDIPSNSIKQNKKNIFTKSGPLLRKYSLDELPQLINIVKGDLNFIGPRPALHNQNDLIDLRVKNGVDGLNPGVTGWSQVNGRDNLSIRKKVELDKYYLNNKSIRLNLIILLKTISQLFHPKNVKH